MIEISINRTHLELDVEIKGHAGAGSYGNDVVCAGVSTLFYTLLNYAEENCETRHRISDGVCRLKAGWISKEAVKFFLTGVRMMEENYPEYVKLIISTGGERCGTR